MSCLLIASTTCLCRRRCWRCSLFKTSFHGSRARAVGGPLNDVAAAATEGPTGPAYHNSLLVVGGGVAGAAHSKKLNRCLTKFSPANGNTRPLWRDAGGRDGRACSSDKTVASMPGGPFLQHLPTRRRRATIRTSRRSFHAATHPRLRTSVRPRRGSSARRSRVHTVRSPHRPTTCLSVDQPAVPADRLRRADGRRDRRSRIGCQTSCFRCRSLSPTIVRALRSSEKFTKSRPASINSTCKHFGQNCSDLVLKTKIAEIKLNYRCCLPWS